MSGRQPAPRTRFERVNCGDPGVVTFKISGSLGPRAKPLLVRLTQECLRRNLPRVVLDLSEVDALGGGTARLLNEFAAERSGRGGKTAFRVVSRTVSGFLCADPRMPPPPLCASLQEAVAAVRDRTMADALSVVISPPAAGASTPQNGAARTLESSAPAHRPSFAPVRPMVDDALFLPEGEALDECDLPELEVLADSHLDPFEPELRAPIALPTPSAAVPPVQLIELRTRVLASLSDRGLAARAFLFEHDPDGNFYLVTRQGIDHERAIPESGALAMTILAQQSPSFLVDLNDDALTDVEAEVLTELNCEVAAPVGSNARLIVFLSKEKPGEEYTLEELTQLEAVLAAAAASFDAVADEPALPAPVAIARGVHAPRAANPNPIGWKKEARDVEPLLAVRSAPLVVDAPPPPAAPQALVAGAVSSPMRPATAKPAPAQPRVATAETQSLQRSVTQMREVLRLSQDFDATLGIARLLEVLLSSVVSVAKVETVLFFAVRSGEYRLTHHRGIAPDSIQGLRLHSDSTLVQAALTTTRGVALATAPQVTEEERLWARQHDLSHAVPFRFKNDILGVLLLGGAVEAGAPDLELLAGLLGQAGVAYDRARLYETLQDRTLGVVRGLVTLIEARNGFDCGSTEHVVRYAQALGRELQYPPESVRDLVYGTVLRDVGMLKVSELLLRSAQDLTADQWETIRRHPQEGAAIMRQMRFSETAIDIVLHHHEAYNGEGYPMGLRGRAIPLGARIVAVAESYVKMLMDRPYRKALGKAEALESLAENWGLRYDPLVVEALVRVVNRELSMGLRGDSDLARDLFGV